MSDWFGASKLWSKIVSIGPSNPPALHLWGVCQFKLGNESLARSLLARALDLPGADAAPILNTLGAINRQAGRLVESSMNLRQAIALNPSFAHAYCNLCATEYDLGNIESAIAAGSLAVKLAPQMHEALLNISNPLRALGKFDLAVRHLNKALELRPDYHEALSNLILCYAYQGEVGLGYQAGLRYEEFCSRTTIINKCSTHLKVHRSTPSIGGLKVGYVSADLYEHAVAFFILDILRHHNRDAFTIYAYSNNLRRDHVTEQIASHVDHWRDCFAMNDDELAEQIRKDEIDILVDLSGHTAGNRLLVFARKPAPVQVTWIGFPGTTGLKAMDYRITDEWLDPPGMTEKYHTETLVRLPHTAFIYCPSPDTPDVNPLPSLQGVPFTLACLNNPAKINSEVIELWAQVLNAIPKSRLMLGNASDAGLVTRLTGEFTSLGISEERLLFQKRLSFKDYMALHHQVDLALDPFPYNGGTTSMHSLWMGVPVITLAGESTPSRVGVSVLGRVDLHQFIASSKDEYVALAKQWSAEPITLNEIRFSLRKRMEEPWNQAEAVTLNLERALLNMWETACRQQST